MTLIEILGLAKKSNASATALRAALDAIDIEGLERRADELEAARRDVLLEGDDAALEKIEAEIAAANRAVERSYAAKERLEARLRDAEGEEVEAARRQRYDDAQRASTEAAKVLKQYEAAARKVAGIIEAVAKAEAVINAANADLPSDAVPLTSVEQSVRGLPAEPEQIIGTEPLPPVWVYTGATKGEVDPGLVGKIETTDGRTGYLQSGAPGAGGLSTRFTVEKRQAGKARVKFISGRAAFVPAPLAASVSLPGFAPGSAPIWEPTGDRVPGQGVDQVQQQAAELADAANQPAVDPRLQPQPQQRVEMMLQSDADKAA